MSNIFQFLKIVCFEGEKSILNAYREERKTNSSFSGLLMTQASYSPKRILMRLCILRC